MFDKILAPIVVVACAVGIAVGVLLLHDRVKCTDLWPWANTTVCAIKH